MSTVRSLRDAARSLGCDAVTVDGDAPVRPSLPLPLALGLAVWAGAAVAWNMACDFPSSVCALSAFANFVVACALLPLFALRGRLLAACVVCGLLIGMSTGFSAGAQLHARQGTVETGGAAAVRLEMVEDVVRFDYGCNGLARAEFEDGSAALVQARFDEEAKPPRYGAFLAVDAKAQAVSRRSTDWAWSQAQAGIVYVDSFNDLERDGILGALVRVRNTAIDSLAGEGETHAILQALVCGYTPSYDATDAKRDFTACGLAHVVAVSGAHLAIVSSFAGCLLRALRIPRFATAALQCLLMAGYLVLTAMPVSAVRAFVMIVVLQVAYFAKRRSLGLASLGACIALMVVVDPPVAVSTSFALSALSTLGIALFGPLLEHWALRTLPVLPETLREALSLTFASSILSQPYSCALFSQLALVSPLSNMVAAPLVAPTCAFGISGALLHPVAPRAGDMLLGIAVWGAEALRLAVAWCASIPFACIPFSLAPPVAFAVTVAGSCVLWAVWPVQVRKPRLVAAACVAATVLIPLAFTCAIAFSRGSQLIMLDVGQGDAFLVRSRGAAILVDTGTNDSLLRAALARHGVLALDAVVITHSDDDHCGSLASLAQTVEVGWVVVAQDALECPCDSCKDLITDARAVAGERIAGMEKGQVMKVGDFHLQAVWPDEYVEEGGNADSLCLLMRGEAGDGLGDAVLLTGDAEEEQISRIVEEQGIDGIGILKVGHHGSRASLTEELAERLDPAIALVSVGAGNRYGHPARKVIELLEHAGASVFRTDEDGDVSCSFTDEGIRVDSMR